jgi:hypothetical protein
MWFQGCPENAFIFYASGEAAAAAAAAAADEAGQSVEEHNRSSRVLQNRSC